MLIKLNNKSLYIWGYSRHLNDQQNSSEEFALELLESINQTIENYNSKESTPNLILKKTFFIIEVEEEK